jgi:hypothetical protein
MNMNLAASQCVKMPAAESPPKECEPARSGDVVTFCVSGLGTFHGVVKRVISDTQPPFAFITVGTRPHSAPWQIALDQLQVKTRPA